MTDTRLTPNTGTLEITGNEAKLTVTRVAETWQFFAFVFAALVTLAFTLLDEIPDGLGRGWRIAGKVVAFFGLAYLTLRNVTVRGWLARFLVRFKEDRR